MKTKTTHTPGPWQFGGFGAVYGPGTTPNVLPNSLPTATFIATAEMGGGLTQVHSKEERNANARLIAAAPELLAALKGLVDAMDADLTIKRGPASPYPFERKNARAAILRAEGPK